MSLSDADRRQIDQSRKLRDELMHWECPGCAGPKQSGKSLCRDCYHALPKDLRRRLYDRIGCGYLEARRDALAFLASINIRRERRA